MRQREEPSGTLVRWRQGHRGSWRYGYINGDQREADGSVRVWEIATGGARSLPLGSLQHEGRGPRGGKRWQWIEARTAPQVTAACKAQSSWKPPPGPAELFNQEPLFGAVTGEGRP